MRTAIVLNRFLNAKRRNGTSLRTLSAYATDLKQLVKFLGTKSIRQLTHTDVTKFSDSLRALRPNSQARKISSLGAFLRWMYESGVLDQKLHDQIKRPKRESVEPMHPLSSSKISRLRRHTSSKERLLLELLLQTGMNLEDATSVFIKHINLEKLLLRHPITGISIPILGPLHQAISYELTTLPQRTRGPLLTNSIGRRLTPRVGAMMLTHLAKKAGVRGVTARNLRATFVDQQLESGTPVEVISTVTSLSLATLSLYKQRTRHQKHGFSILLNPLSQ